jgi:hypothetical protein
VKEDFLYFDSCGKKIFAAIVSPGAGRGNGKGVIVCSPLGEEKVRTYRVLRNLSRLLCESGFTVIRFDYMGEGDSEGEFEESTLESRVSNALDAMGILQARTGCGEVMFLGLRFGGTLAVAAAAASGNHCGVVLWHPVVDCAAYFYDLLRSNLTLQTRAFKKVLYNREQLIERMKGGEVVDIEGYGMTWGFYRQGISLDLLEKAKAVRGDSLVVQISKGEIVQEDLMELHNRLRGNPGRHDFLTVPKEFQWEDLKFYCPHPKGIFEKTREWLGYGG